MRCLDKCQLVPSHPMLKDMLFVPSLCAFSIDTSMDVIFEPFVDFIPSGNISLRNRASDLRLSIMVFNQFVDLLPNFLDYTLLLRLMSFDLNFRYPDSDFNIVLPDFAHDYLNYDLNLHSVDLDLGGHVDIPEVTIELFNTFNAIEQMWSCTHKDDNDEDNDSFSWSLPCFNFDFELDTTSFKSFCVSLQNIDPSSLVDAFKAVELTFKHDESIDSDGLNAVLSNSYALLQNMDSFDLSLESLANAYIYIYEEVMSKLGFPTDNFYAKFPYLLSKTYVEGEFDLVEYLLVFEDMIPSEHKDAYYLALYQTKVTFAVIEFAEKPNFTNVLNVAGAIFSDGPFEWDENVTKALNFACDIYTAYTKISAAVELANPVGLVVTVCYYVTEIYDDYFYGTELEGEAAQFITAMSLSAVCPVFYILAVDAVLDALEDSDIEFLQKIFDSPLYKGFDTCLEFILGPVDDLLQRFSGAIFHFVNNWILDPIMLAIGGDKLQIAGWVLEKGFEIYGAYIETIYRTRTQLMEQAFKRVTSNATLMMQNTNPYLLSEIIDYISAGIIETGKDECSYVLLGHAKHSRYVPINENTSEEDRKSVFMTVVGNSPANINWFKYYMKIRRDLYLVYLENNSDSCDLTEKHMQVWIKYLLKLSDKRFDKLEKALKSMVTRNDYSSFMPLIAKATVSKDYDSIYDLMASGDFNKALSMMAQIYGDPSDLVDFIGNLLD